jgi:hypothetical protein
VVAEAAGFDGAAGGVRARVEEEDNGRAGEMRERDFVSILIGEGEVFYEFAGLHSVLLGSFCLKQYSE